MSKLIIGDQFWATMTEGRKIEAVVKGHATLKQMSEGLLDGSDQLRHACLEYLGDAGLSFENLPLDPNDPNSPTASATQSTSLELIPNHAGKARAEAEPHGSKQRFGLPTGFLPRLQRYGRTVLIEKNIYRLPNGQEFIPVPPTGTLGIKRHRYALLTEEQYLKAKRGSIYVRSDGKIFDYSVDNRIPLREMFDTGYTIGDLERTGGYAPELRPPKKRATAKAKHPKAKHAAAGK
ncbi:MAG TPA: hypothetical protein VIW64_02075 [Pyrinomonadaceae bacterium]|jgi:hypothetical protein